MVGDRITPTLIYISGLKLFVNPMFFGQKQGFRDVVSSTRTEVEGNAHVLGRRMSLTLITIINTIPSVQIQFA